MASTTQDHLPIQDIHDDVVILKDGTMVAVIQTSAVNFGLLSENEQLAIISAFAGLLNSLSFMIQVVIRSKRLDISSYLRLLDQAQSEQKNPLLSEMIYRYRSFIESTIRENEVLDKKFYIVIPVSSLELGIIKNIEGNFKKGITILVPRRDHIVRQLSRIGLRATQLNTKELITLFFDIYNDSADSPANFMEPDMPEPQLAVQQKLPTPLPKTPPAQQPQKQATPDLPPLTFTQQPVQPTVPPAHVLPLTQPAMQSQRREASGNGPFVVEELEDDYGVVR